MRTLPPASSFLWHLTSSVCRPGVGKMTDSFPLLLDLDPCSRTQKCPFGWSGHWGPTGFCPFLSSVFLPRYHFFPPDLSQNRERRGASEGMSSYRSLPFPPKNSFSVLSSFSVSTSLGCARTSLRRNEVGARQLLPKQHFRPCYRQSCHRPSYFCSWAPWGLLPC